MARTINEASLAAWFGGSLMGAVGLRRASESAGKRRLTVEGEGWKAWQPVQTGAIVAQIASGAALTVSNRSRIVAQRSVATTSALRTAAMAGAMVATMLARRGGAQAERAAADGQPIEGVERRTRALQAAVPALTGAMLVLDAVMGEQQRPNQVARGVVGRILPDRLRRMAA